jgi:hypothetical protein
VWVGSELLVQKNKQENEATQQSPNL